MTEKSEQQPTKKSGNGLVAIVVLGTAAAVSSFATVYALTPVPGAESAACEASVQTADHAVPLAKPDQTYVELPEMTVTIGQTPATRYLKMNLVIITGKDKVDAVQSAQPVLIDAFLNYLRSIELTDFEDPGFYSDMRLQLTRRSELVLGNKASHGVLITEFLLR